MSRLLRLPAFRIVAAASMGYMALACLLTWPLLLQLTTHLTGSPTGDTGVYVWNLWVFAQELLQHHRPPISTDYVFAASGGADFSFHNYTPLAGLLAVPLLHTLGIVGTFNVILLLAVVTSALGAFALARQAGVSAGAAWLGGALFVAAPAFVARDTAHFSLVAAAPLPVFAALLLRIFEQRRMRQALALGFVVAAAAYCDVYYGVYAVLIGIFLAGWRFVRVEPRGPAHPTVMRATTVALCAVAAVVSWPLLFGATRIHIGPVRVGLDTVYNPMLAFVTLGAARLWQRTRPALRLHDPDGVVPDLLHLAAASVATCLVALLPMLVGIALNLADGTYPVVPIHWRSSPRGVDLLAYLAPNPLHPWFGDMTRRWVLPPAADAFPEFTAAFPLTAWLVILIALWRGGLPRMWVAFTGVFLLLSLGPFLHVGGVNTQTVAPWAFLRYVPVVGLARSPARFSLVAILGLSMLTAFAVERWRTNEMARRRWIPVLFAAALAFELWPAPRVLYSAAVPEVYEMVLASDGYPEGRLLELPTGIRDGVSSIGDFNASTQFFQTHHGRPLVGGYLSRVSERRKEEGRTGPVRRVLFHLSEGKPVPQEWLIAAHEARERFLARSCVRYVIVDKRRASARLREVATDVLDLVPVHEDDRYALLWPMNPPACEPRPRRQGLFGAQHP